MEYLAVYPETLTLIRRYPKEERYDLIEAASVYANDLTEPDWPEDDIKWFVWEAMKQPIDRAIAKSEQAQQNAKGRNKQTEAKECEPKQTEAEDSKTDNKTKIEIEKEIDIKENHLTVVKEKRRFSPPTLDEVKEYCAERHNDVDPQRFIDFYASKGWKVGNQPMKDWKAAVRTWEQRDDRSSARPSAQPVRQVTAQQYTQRTYTEDELEDRTLMADILAEAAAL